MSFYPSTSAPVNLSRSRTQLFRLDGHTEDGSDTTGLYINIGNDNQNMFNKHYLL